MRAEKAENRNNFDLYSIVFIGNIRNSFFSFTIFSAHFELSIYYAVWPFLPHSRLKFGHCSGVKSSFFRFFLLFLCIMNAIAINFDLTFRPNKNVKRDFSTSFGLGWLFSFHSKNIFNKNLLLLLKTNHRENEWWKSNRFACGFHVTNAEFQCYNYSALQRIITPFTQFHAICFSFEFIRNAIVKL